MAGNDFCVLLIDILAQAFEFHEEVSHLVGEALEAVMQVCELFFLGFEVGSGAVGDGFGDSGESVVVMLLLGSLIVAEILVGGVFHVCVVPVFMPTGDNHSVEFESVRVLLACGGGDPEMVAFGETHTIGVEAVFAVNLHDQTAALLTHELEFTGLAQVAVFVVTLSKCQTLRVGLRAEVLGSIVEETSNLSSCSAILIHDQCQSVKGFHIIDAVHAHIPIFGIPKLEISRSNLLPGSAEFEGRGEVGGAGDVFGPQCSLGVSGIGRSEDETVGKMLDFVVDVGDLIARDGMALVGKVLVSMAETELVDGVGGTCALGGYGTEGGEEEGGEGAEEELGGHFGQGDLEGEMAMQGVD